MDRVKVQRRVVTFATPSMNKFTEVYMIDERIHKRQHLRKPNQAPDLDGVVVVVGDLDEQVGDEAAGHTGLATCDRSFGEDSQIQLI